MGYHLRGLLLPAGPPLSTDLHTVTLPRGLRLIPLPDAVLDALPDAPSGSVETEAFTNMNSRLAGLIADLSQAERVAYVEAEYFGGTGTQVAAVWDGGRLLWGPQRAERGPINEALRLLGVHRTRSRDEFECAGLDRHRYLEDWLE